MLNAVMFGEHCLEHQFLTHKHLQLHFLSARPRDSRNGALSVLPRAARREHSLRSPYNIPALNKRHLGRSEKASRWVCVEGFLHVSREDAEELEALAHLLGVGKHVVARQQVLSCLWRTVGQEFLE